MGALKQRPEVVLCSMENLADPKASCKYELPQAGLPVASGRNFKIRPGGLVESQL